MLRVFTQVAEEMAEEGKYAQKQRKLLPSKIMFVPEGGKIPVEKQKISLAESESYGQCKVSADLREYQGFFPIRTLKKPELVVLCDENQEVHLMELTVPPRGRGHWAFLRQNEQT